MGNFSQDLKIGEKAENFLIKELQEELPGLKSTQGNFPDYDLISDSGYTIEVKFDAISRTTGNVDLSTSVIITPQDLLQPKPWSGTIYPDPTKSPRNRKSKCGR